MKLTTKILEKTKQKRIAEDFHTTSFTIKKTEYANFKEACKKLNTRPSEVLRELILLFIEENETI